jgi:3-oxosteroid 1-dehydrogenase
MSETRPPGLDQSNWDHHVDLLIVGSGAGAMTAAIIASDLGAKVLLIEKGSQYGGSSAMSAGGLWIPCNPIAREAGIADDPEQAWNYLKGCVRDGASDARLKAYLDSAPELVKTLRAATHVDFTALEEYPDYYPRVAGSLPGGRSLDPKKFDAKTLGHEFLNMREGSPQQLIFGRIAMTIPEARAALTRTPGWLRIMFGLFARYALDLPWRFKSKRDRNLTMGSALVGTLRRSLMDRNIELWLDTPAEAILQDPKGRVVGMQATRAGRSIRIGARRGVILAAGGFEANQAMREKYLPQPTRAEWSSANPNNTGDIISMGQRIGADLDLMDEAWWGPCFRFPGEARARFAVVELSLPGSVLVNRRGHRFVNEACPYGDKVAAMYEKNHPESESVPSYLIFDASFRSKYPVGPMLPGQQQPDWAVPAPILSMFEIAESIPALARKLDIESAALEATVVKMNDYAAQGKDPDFGRGDTVFDRYYGDDKAGLNPNLGPISTPPFYGIRVYPGELGTKGGLRVDERARVLNESRTEIPGLYATGNCTASVMGRSYPGAGATLGPAMTFGMIAARDAMDSR